MALVIRLGNVAYYDHTKWVPFIVDHVNKHCCLIWSVRGKKNWTGKGCNTGTNGLLCSSQKILSIINKYYKIQSNQTTSEFRPTVTANLTLIWTKALQYKLFSVKALSKRLQKLTIKMKRLLQLKPLSFVNVNN